MLVSLGLTGQDRVNNSATAFRSSKLKSFSSVKSKFKVVKARNGDLDGRKK